MAEVVQLKRLPSRSKIQGGRHSNNVPESPPFPVLTVPHEHTVRYLSLVPVSESRPATATPCMFSELCT
jgi:hypothetical protein